jgi:SagB-type dehydrogenase family enzyme
MRMRDLRWGAILTALVLVVPTCVDAEERVKLPQPDREGELTLERALSRRRSVRSFSERGLDLDQISQILWAAGGATVDGVSGPTRSAPSAGGLYPCELLVVVGRADGIAPGVYRYLWRPHELERLKSGDYRRQVARAALNQSFVGQAPICVVIAAVFERTTRKYGLRGAERYVGMDAGHMAQNVVLQSAAIGLGATTVGAFQDDEVARVLGMGDEVPLYLIPVGWPR